MSVTLKDIAARAGVSESMVSRVLNNKRGIRDKSGSVAHIRRIAEEMAYQPSVVARALAGKTTGMLGVVFSLPGLNRMSGTYEGMLLDGIFVAAGDARQNVVLFTRWAWDEERQQNELSAGQCDGLLLISPFRSNDLVGTLARKKLPIVVVSDMRPEPGVTCVDIDNDAAGHAATSHLIELGHRRIAVVQLDDVVGCNQPRLRGYLRAMEEHGLEVHPNWLLRGSLPDWENDRLSDDLQAVFTLPKSERPTAVFCFGDHFARYVIELLTQMGLAVPADVSIMGFNDDSFIQMKGSPELTTIRQPITAIGSRAVEILLEQVDGAKPGRKEIFPHELVVRQSTAPPPH